MAWSVDRSMCLYAGPTLRTQVLEWEIGKLQIKLQPKMHNHSTRGTVKMPYKSEFSRRLLTTYLSRFAIFGIILALLAGRVRAEFLYVTNGSGNSISAYRIGENG